MLPAAVNFCDSGIIWNLNSRRFELVLKSPETERTVLALAPTEDLAIFATEETLVTTASNLTDASNRDFLDEDRRVFESHWVIDSELAVFVCTHRVKIVVVGHEASVPIATSHLTDGDVVGAKLGEGVHLVSSQVDAQAELTLVVGTP